MKNTKFNKQSVYGRLVKQVKELDVYEVQLEKELAEVKETKEYLQVQVDVLESK